MFVRRLDHPDRRRIGVLVALVWIAAVVVISLVSRARAGWVASVAASPELNRALHTVILHRRLHDPATKDYIPPASQKAKQPRDAVRLLKRYLARHLYRVLQNQTPLMT